MTNFMALNYEPIIAQLREQKALLTKALQQIDQAITSLEAIAQLGLVQQATFDSPSLSPYMVSAIKETPEPAEPQKRPDLPFRIKEEVPIIVEQMSGKISQPQILKHLIDKYPGTDKIAKERQLGARISTELKALESDGILVLTEKGTSNFPNVYMKTSEAAEEDRGYLKPL